MSASTIRTTVISSWIVGLLVVVGLGVLTGFSVNGLNVTLVALAALVPPAMLMLLRRPAPPAVARVSSPSQRDAVVERLRQIELGLKRRTLD